MPNAVEGAMTITWVGKPSNHDTRLVMRIWFDKMWIHYLIAGDRHVYQARIKDVAMILDDATYTATKR